MSASWSVCPECRTLVAEEGGHRAWHEALASRLGGVDGAAPGPSWAGDPVPAIPPMSEQERAEQDTRNAAVQAIVVTSAAAHTDGAPWVRPTGAHDAYRKGITATRDGKTWESLISFNVTMPGDPSDPQAYRWWKDVTPGPDPPDGPQPWSGNGVRYLVGKELTFEGVTYRVRQEHTSQPDWTPNLVPALYLPI